MNLVRFDPFREMALLQDRVNRAFGLALRDGAWFVTVSPTVQNITQLDGREIPRGVAQPLLGDHVLRLSTQCEVRLKVTGQDPGT